MPFLQSWRWRYNCFWTLFGCSCLTRNRFCIVVQRANFCGVILQVSLYCTNESLLTCYSHWKTSTQVLPQTAQLLLLSFSDRPEIQNKKNKPDKGLFTWSGGLRSSGVGFFCFVPQSVKTKETNPTRPGSPTPCKQGLSKDLTPGDLTVALLKAAQAYNSRGD